jgi:2-polyprenyl-3-methyl-5-hydroxy-6-metoxy-1,4-benzoquinol methylase
MSASAAIANATAPACPCCASTASSAAFAVPDRNRMMSRDEFHYRRCDACATVWLEDVPADLAAHYPADYHDFPAGEELEAAVRAELPRLALITAHVSGGQLVEIGSSQGVFSYAALRAGFDVTALEMDAECCAHLRGVLGVRAINTADPATVLAGLPPSRAIVMWHVVEHVPAPARLLAAVVANLEPGGVLAVATPNPLSLQARMLGRRWLHVDAPRHLTLIPLPALAGVVGRHGMRQVSATTVDPIGLRLNELGWERSLVRAPTLGPGRRFAFTFRTLGAGLGPIERRGLRGATYTAVFRKDG